MAELIYKEDFNAARDRLTKWWQGGDLGRPAMISPDMFGEFMVPVLKKMTSQFDHCMYHWDGLRAIVHHDHLLSLPDLDMIQWTLGTGTD